MTLYIVIAGNSYYPGRGTSDWKNVCTDLDDANEWYDHYMSARGFGDLPRYDWVTLVELDESGGYITIRNDNIFS